MKKREGNGLGWGLICFTGIIFAMMVMVLPAMADDCGVADPTHPLTGYFGDNSAAPYTKSQNDNTVTDSNKLMWESIGSTQMMDWSAACYRCDQLTLAGETDWRLPTVEELEKIVNEQMTPTINAEFTAKEGPYWTKSVPSGFETNAFMVSFTDGQSAISDKTTPLYSRCVRDGASSSRETLKVSLKVAVLVDGNNDLKTIESPIAAAPDVMLIPQENIGSMSLLPQKDGLDATPADSAIYFEVITVKRDDVALGHADMKPVDKLDYIWTVDDPTVQTALKDASAATGSGGAAGQHSIRALLNELTPSDPSLGETTPPGTYTVTVEVWDHENPRNYGKASVTITICNGDCTMDATGNGEQCEYQKGATYINQDLTLKLKSLFYQDKEADPKIKLELPQLELKMVPDPVGNRILFALQIDDQSDDKDKDGDGYATDGSSVLHPGLKDCDDNNPLIHPDAKETYGNKIDEDCFPTSLD